MSDKKAAIKVNKVYKDFALPHERARSVKSGFTSVFKTKNRRVESQHALRDISFEIKEGEFFGIVGRNGSGKSTLLKILAGIYQPTKGRVNISGKLVPFIELGVGFNPELTGRENVYLNGALLGFTPQQIKHMYQDIVSFAELERFMDQKLKNYSSGMQVRLAFSVAIMAKAEILLIDEVLAVGDADFQRKCFEYFKSLKRDKRTVVFVSHDMAAVQQYCDRALLINKSEVMEIGSPATIAAHYNQLFMDQEKKPESKGAKTLSGEERWGDNQANWLKVTTDLPDRKLSSPDTITITATGKANQDVEFPIFGFSIKDDSFQQITGHNTVRKQVKIAPLKKGEKFTVSWQVPNIFNTGRYYVDCTIAHDQATMVSDRWPDATSFSIGRIDNNPYPIWTDVELTYNGSKKG